MDLDKLTIDRGTGPRRAYRRRAPLLRWLALALVVALAWLLRAPLLGAFERASSIEVEVAAAVLVGPRERAAASGVAANGYVVARRRAALSADSPGRIVELNVQEGSVVSRGDVVARLFADELEAALRRAEAELVGGRAGERAAAAQVELATRQLEEARAATRNVEAARDEVAAALGLTERDLERIGGLVESGAVTAERFDQAESARVQARARLAAAEAAVLRAAAAASSAEAGVAVAEVELERAGAQVKALEAGRDLARASLDKTFVRAPFDGVVVLKDAEVGEVVSPNALGGQSRGSVATMVDFSTLEIQVELPETSLSSVSEGRPAEVFVDAFPDDRLSGRVLRIWPTANRQKATVEIRVGLDELDPRLRPEMGARVVFAAQDGPVAGAEGSGPAGAEDAAPRLVVPSAALVERAGRRGVFVVDDGVARFRTVAAGTTEGARVTVDDGLSAGERVVVAPPDGLDDGDRVRESR